MRVAVAPISGSPASGKCTTDGVSRVPFASASKIGKPASITPMSEFVVPRSIPTMSPVIASGVQPRLSWQAAQPCRHDLDAVTRLGSHPLHERRDDEDDREDHQ